MQFTERDSGLIVPVEKPEPQPLPPPEPPRGAYCEPWPDSYCRHESEAWLAVKTGTPFDLKINVHSSGSMFGGNLDCGDVLDRIIRCVNACRHLSDDDLQFVADGTAELDIMYREIH